MTPLSTDQHDSRRREVRGFLRAGALQDKAIAAEKRNYYATDAGRLQATVPSTGEELLAMSANPKLSDIHLEPVDARAWQLVMLSPGSQR